MTITRLERIQLSLGREKGFNNEQLVAGTSVGSDAQRIHMIATDRRYRGERLSWAASEMCRQVRLILPPPFGHRRRCLRRCVLG
jgi:hypothetical protein